MIGIVKQEGKRNMMKNLALAASITMLVVISGEAFAATAPNARYWSETTGPSDRQQTADAFNAFDMALATQTDESDAHRYHGGPKSND
jgi:hypothetical protein